MTTFANMVFELVMAFIAGMLGGILTSWLLRPKSKDIIIRKTPKGSIIRRSDEVLWEEEQEEENLSKVLTN